MVNAAAKNLSYVMSECSVASFTLMNGKTGKWWEVLHRHTAALNNQIPSIDSAHSFRDCTAQVSDLSASNWVNQLLTNGGTAED